MNFVYLDILLLILFVGFTALFLIKNKNKIKKEGMLLLYHTSWGLKLIKKTGEKYKKTLKFLSWVSVSLGYLLMTGMIWMFGKIVWLYIFHGDLVRAVKVPPIMPLIPYLPQMFKLSFLPPFYFSYWIIILAIIAITHEFFHGIFASLNKVKTKTTGFGFFPFFLPIFLAAFVNLDEKIMAKKTSFQQRAVLSAGTFANLLTAGLGVLLMWGFFALSFSPAGVVYNDYAYEVVNINDITSVNGVPMDFAKLDLKESLEKINTFSDIRVKDKNFKAVKALDPNSGLIALYYDSPAFNKNLSGAILKIDENEISSLEVLSRVLSKYSPGEKVIIEIFNGESNMEIDLILGENPKVEDRAWIGISFFNQKASGIIGKISTATTFYKQANVYYEPSFEFAKFIYDLLWWLVIISFSVALVNMLPIGIFDGGRFFYLTILTLTKSQKTAERSFRILTQIFILALFVIMFMWVKNIF
jgi:membrane-associated protease RseP (regulator of RpoE activity)